MDVPTRKPTIRRRRIIERPRLIRALDRSHARVRMLIASAGYGKTILLEQWTARDSIQAAWFRARRSSADVAVLSRGLADAAAELVPGCDRRVSERLLATKDPSEDAGILAEILADDLQDWREDCWLVIDDYQHVCGSEPAETFVETLLQHAPVRLVLASRTRPTWVSGRRILYGDVLEVSQTTMAMSADEVDEVLAGSRPNLSQGLLALAEGWPAVIGLASLSTTTTIPDVEVPEALYEFFADEVYRALDPEMRRGLGLLAVAPLLDRELAAELLGADSAGRVLDEALAFGMLDERGGRLELHPLAAAFLEARAPRYTGRERTLAAGKALTIYRERGEWDAAFDIVERCRLDSDLALLFAVALDDLLNAARLATIDTWAERARERSLEAPIFEVGRAELNLRQGRHVTALSQAERALEMGGCEGEVEYRTLLTAARAAHVGSLEEEALDYYKRAVAAATHPDQEREARWGEVMCAAALELTGAQRLFDDLEKNIVRTRPRELVRITDKRLSLGFRFGRVDQLAEARRVSELVSEVDDPVARCSFLSMYSCGLNLGAYYGDALEQAERLLTDARDHRVDLALPYGHAMSAIALSGLRRFDDAAQALEEAFEVSRKCNDVNGQQTAYAIQVRLLLQQGLAADACALEPPDLGRALKAMRGEVLASRALAFACVGRLDDAVDLAAEAASTTHGVEANVLKTAVEMVVGVRRRVPNLIDLGNRLVEHAFKSGAVDLAVCTYRASPDVLGSLLSNKGTRERTGFIISRASDQELASELGWNPSVANDPATELTRREQEVYSLLCNGLSNREIATRLFISEATVKVHVHHVYDKLGVRSRTALMINARAPTPTQAASTSRSGPPSATASRS